MGPQAGLSALGLGSGVLTMGFVRREGIVLLLAVLVLSALVGACEGPAWENDPDVQAVRTACAGLRKMEHYSCVEDAAVERLNPDVCHLIAAGLDDLCLQAVYEAAGDPAICAEMYLRGAKENCRTWYANPTPRLDQP